MVIFVISLFKKDWEVCQQVVDFVAIITIVKLYYQLNFFRRNTV
jgi:hypothetical protein